MHQHFCIAQNQDFIIYFKWGGSKNPFTAAVTDGWASIHHTFQSVPSDCLPEQNENPSSEAEYVLPAQVHKPLSTLSFTIQITLIQQKARAHLFAFSTVSIVVGMCKITMTHMGSLHSSQYIQIMTITKQNEFNCNLRLISQY